MLLRPCAACGQHVQVAALACPHCGTSLGGKLTRSAAAVVMGLTLIGANDPETRPTPEPEYGVVFQPEPPPEPEPAPPEPPPPEPPPPAEDPAPIITEAIYGVSATVTPRRLRRTEKPADVNVTNTNDEDNDGISAQAGDCDDADPTVLPGAEERRFDGVDSDCDGKNNR